MLKLASAPLQQGCVLFRIYLIPHQQQTRRRMYQRELFSGRLDLETKIESLANVDVHVQRPNDLVFQTV
jgi:hypothetical protein